MIEPTKPAAEAPSPVPENPAIARCMNAWKRVYQEELAKPKSRDYASLRADEAYRSALPQLCGYENIRDFIACIAHAMIIGALREDQASKLLYAAQVAHSTLCRQPAPPKSAA
jgi:hypothetical protein